MENFLIKMVPWLGIASSTANSLNLSRKRIELHPIKQGKLNKKCNICGHKNKKCTCKN